MKWQLVLIALKAAMLVSGVARGEVVKIHIDCPGEPSAMASAVTVGVLDDGRCALLTAGHVTHTDASYRIEWHDSVIDAECLASQFNGADDIAVLAAVVPGLWSTFPLCSLKPQERVKVDVVGFKLGVYTRRNGECFAGDEVVRGVAVDFGDSGGAVGSKSTGLVGIISAKAVNEVATLITPAHRIRRFLDENNIKIDQRPMKVETQCRNGQCYTQPYGGYVIQSPALIVRPRSVEIAVPPPVIQDPRATYPGGIRKPVVPPPPREEPIAQQQPPCQCKPSRGCNCSTPMVGANGAPGPTGPRGPKGEPGERCECKSVDGDISALKAEIKRLKETPTRVQIKENGKLVDEDVYQPGQPIVLDFTPVE